MHLSCESKAEEREQDRLAGLRGKAEMVDELNYGSEWTHKEVLDSLMQISGIKERAASNHLGKLKGEGFLILNTETGKYRRDGTK